MAFDNYTCEGQMNIFDFLDEAPKTFKIDKPIRLIELFAGIGAQAKALERLKANFEHYKISEWEVHATASYHKIHMKEDKTDYSEPYSDKELIDKLDAIGISVDGKKPMSRTKIKAKGEKWHRRVYNDFMATHNIGSITNVGGQDLEIIDKDKYCYILTYSFPCQDLSVAGKQKGMSKDSGTRSGLLWEVERLLRETINLPQVLLMENVPQVHGAKFKADFVKWCLSLERLGYSNYWEDLNAKNYGVAQNRNRTFMVSILNNGLYEFPKPIKLEKTVEDYLEEQVDEKYYINSERANELISKLISDGILDKSKLTPFDNAVSYSLRSREFEKVGFQKIVPALCARDYKDPKVVVEKKDAECVGGYGKVGSTNQYHFQNRVYQGDIAVAVCTCANPYYVIREDNDCSNEGEKSE